MNNRILVVDDEKDIVQAYLDLLNPTRSSSVKHSSRKSAATTKAEEKASVAEYEILKAYSGEEALALMQSEYAAGRRVVGGFFDVKLEGGMDGLQLIRELWKLDPDLLCTVVTAYHDRSVDDIDQLFGSQFKDQWDYLNKPFTQAEIVQKARQIVASWNRKEELKQTQAQLLHSERLAAIGQVARSIGHEFGNILLAIMGNADLAMRSTDQETTYDRLKTIMQTRLQVIVQAAEKASLIVRNLNSFSKKESTRASADPVQLITTTLSLLTHEIRKNNVDIIQSVKACGPIYVSAPEVEQVLLNLIINAIHAMRTGGSIEVGCKEESEQVWMWVKDSGSGIRPEVLPFIFDYAFTTKGEKGSGLGLAISKQILESHGGTLSVETTVGKGSTFTLKLPKGGG